LNNNQLLGSGVDFMKRFFSGEQIMERHCFVCLVKAQKNSKKFAVRKIEASPLFDTFFL